ncbi:DinB family protein [Sediminitomix flava]|uniref:DinB family protein n=1 Tax=Sediminitomix flava TaxID=379075 RepID=A0A315ZHD7_SEDFL|nr:DinB family protein [Sediminitomix flava]PWJ44609.1 DinB family protein [Sediminitomix flava]
MKIASELLIEDLIDRTREVLNESTQLMSLSEKELNFRMEENKWSVLECIEHLNLYGDFYIPEIGKQMSRYTGKSSLFFRSSWLGNYFANMMLPREKLNKIQTFKDKNPIGSQLNKQVIEKFIHQQKDILNLLHEAQNVDLRKVKTGISISNWIKLRLGDTFRVVIYHNQRHIVQAKRTLRYYEEKTSEKV